MFDVGLPEFFVLGLVALLVFGPERLPEVALQAARLIRKLKGMADSARSELAADLEPHMRELGELRELDPRKMAKRYILDPVEKDGTLDEVRGISAGLKPSAIKKSARRPRKAPAAAAAAAASAADGTPAGGDVDLTGGLSANGSAAPEDDGPALPPAMAPSVTPAGERPPYDVDAT